MVEDRDVGDDGVGCGDAERIDAEFGGERIQWLGSCWRGQGGHTFGFHWPDNSGLVHSWGHISNATCISLFTSFIISSAQKIKLHFTHQTYDLLAHSMKQSPIPSDSRLPSDRRSVSDDHGLCAMYSKKACLECSRQIDSKNPIIIIKEMPLCPREINTG